MIRQITPDGHPAEVWRPEIETLPRVGFGALVRSLGALPRRARLLVVSAHRLDTTLARAFPILVGLGVAFALLRVLLTALTTHSPTIDGPPEYLWLTLPSFGLPRLLGGFTVGGTIEGDVVLYAAAVMLRAAHAGRRTEILTPEEAAAVA